MKERSATDIVATIDLVATVDQVWDLVSDTARYADWVDECLAVTYHHGQATLGGIYKEIGRGVGPLRTHTTWTVAEIDPPRYRRDTGVGMPLVSSLESIFELEPIVAGPRQYTRFTWHNRYRPALGSLGRLIDSAQQGQLRAMMQNSLVQLAKLVEAEPEGDPS